MPGNAATQNAVKDGEGVGGKWHLTAPGDTYLLCEGAHRLSRPSSENVAGLVLLDRLGPLPHLCAGPVGSPSSPFGPVLTRLLLLGRSSPHPYPSGICGFGRPRRFGSRSRTERRRRAPESEGERRSPSRRGSSSPKSRQRGSCFWWGTAVPLLTDSYPVGRGSESVCVTRVWRLSDITLSPVT